MPILNHGRMVELASPCIGCLVCGDLRRWLGVIVGSHQGGVVCRGV